MTETSSWSFNFHDLPQLFYTKQTPGGLVINRKVDTEVQLVAYEATKYGIQVEVIPDTELVAFSLGSHTEYVLRHFHSHLKTLGHQLCVDKYATRTLLAHRGLPVTKGLSLSKTSTESEWQTVFELLQKPLVVKSYSGSQGIGVYLNITTWEEFKEKVALVFSDLGKHDTKAKAVIEETAVGKEYRILATSEEILAVMYRQPASVVGDGVHTIQELVEIKNQLPIRNIDHEVYPHMTIDEQVVAVLAEQGKTPNSVPANQATIFLRHQSNIMSGGDAFDMTDEIHPSVAQIAVNTVRAIPGLPFAGIDFMTTDITNDQAQEQCAIIEVNSAPEFAMHDMPMYGKSRDVAKKFLLTMFPELR